MREGPDMARTIRRIAIIAAFVIGSGALAAGAQPVTSTVDNLSMSGGSTSLFARYARRDA